MEIINISKIFLIKKNSLSVHYGNSDFLISSS